MNNPIRIQHASTVNTDEPTASKTFFHDGQFQRADDVYPIMRISPRWSECDRTTGIEEQ